MSQWPGGPRIGLDFIGSSPKAPWYVYPVAPLLFVAGCAVIVAPHLLALLRKRLRRAPRRP
jgi:hypothetical protein